MPAKRSSDGVVRGYHPDQVKAVFLRVLTEYLRPSDAFTRAMLRKALRVGVADVTPHRTNIQLTALEHAFFRTVAPVPASKRGVFAMPRDAIALVENRGFRLAAGRLSVMDVIQLAGALDSIESRGGVLTPALKAKLVTCTKALRSLGLQANTWRI